MKLYKYLRLLFGSNPYDLAKLLYYRKLSPLFVNYNDTDNLKYLNINLPEFDLDINKYSDDYLDNKLTVWGRVVDLGSNVNWHMDYYSKYVWPMVWHNQIRKHSIVGADIKFPWEVSRMHQLLWLSISYKKTKDKKYIDKYVRTFDDWVQNNPVGFGVNWDCTMDVAIRASNFLVSFSILEHKFDDEFKQRFANTLYKHGLFIRHNLEYSAFRGNHYTSNLVGLLFIGLFFKNNEFGTSWLEFAITELEHEIVLQTNSDGSNFENSISYHRLTTELFLYSYIISKLNGLIFSDKYLSILKSQLQYIYDYTKPNGLAPIFGDNDSGHLFYFPCFDNRDHRYLLNLSKEYLNFVPKECEFAIYPDTGVAIYKTKDLYLAFKNSKLGFKGFGGHNHNDSLSFELNYKGRDIFVDTGTYVYTPDSDNRNNLRSTKNHNTIYVGTEQNDLSKDLFMLKGNSNPSVIKFDPIKRILASKITYDSGIEHERTIHLGSSVIKIVDSVNSKENSEFNLIIHPYIKIKLNTNLKTNEVIIDENYMSVNPDILRDSIYCSDYYSKVDTKKISIGFVDKMEYLIKLR